jgi:hypothetical protein
LPARFVGAAKESRDESAESGFMTADPLAPTMDRAEPRPRERIRTQ